MEKKKVLVGMSGGVDSSAAALILIEQGYEVYGATMRLIPSKSEDFYLSTENDAKKVCEKLGIKHFVLDFRNEFKKNVMDYFAEEYLNARTPNPCIACNKHLKFGLMLYKALEMGMDYIATGHYAVIEEKNGEYALKMSDNKQKDQSYVLYNMNQFILSHTLMPLGKYEKPQIRKMCEEKGLITAKKSDSMEICFVEDNDYKNFIKNNYSYKENKGKIVDTFGNVLGKHNGLINYTVGQRKGIGAYGRPMFVLRLDFENNSLVLGEKGMEFSKVAYADNLNFLNDKYKKKEFLANVKIRYQANPARAKITLEEDFCKIEFFDMQRALTPGQSVVFYDGEYVIGGGIVKN